MKNQEIKFKFRNLDNIGVPAAEEDKLFLENCFVDNGYLKTLTDCNDPRRLVLGRTGVGKTALLLKILENTARSIEVKPESLALSYISNSTVLNFISELGVKLDVFFKLLWRHVFTVEILKAHFKIHNEKSKASFLDKVKNLFRDDKHIRAIGYLEKWGQSFWEETEYRIKEVTAKLENDIKLAVQPKIGDSNFSMELARKLTEEEKKDVISRAQYVVNAVQIRQLSDIIEMVDNVLDDPQKRYYIVIDRLDEEWVEEKLRYRLIRALIETIKDFRKIRHAKIITAIRMDLLNRVYKLTKDSGFQEEKYESIYLCLEWSDKSLIEILDKRINFLIKQRYTNELVTHKDILPNKKVADKSAIDYMLERTLKRPRDIIQFLNYCITKAIDKPQITWEMLKQAEGEYSCARLQALADEWFSDYPNLKKFTPLLESKPKHFTVEEISVDACEEICLQVLYSNYAQEDDFSIAAKRFVEGQISIQDFRKSILKPFYLVGLVELKTNSYERFVGVSRTQKDILLGDITDVTKISIHPTFCRALGVSDK